MGMEETASIAKSLLIASWGCPEAVAEEATTPLRAQVETAPPLLTAVGKALRPTEDMGLAPDADASGSKGPPDGGPTGPPGEGPPEGPPGRAPPGVKPGGRRGGDPP